MSKRSYAAMMGGAAPAAARAARLKKGQASAAERRRANVSAARAVAVAVRAQSELKGVDTALTYNPVLATTSTNAGIFVVNLIVPGNGSFNRVGRKVHMKSLRLFGSFRTFISPAATTGSLLGNTVRMVVVYDKQPSGVLPTYDTIFGTTVPDGTEAGTFLAPLRYDNTGRFRVLRDVRVDMNAGANPGNIGTEDGQYVRSSFDEYIKLGALETIYSGQSSPQTIADISSGALYVAFRAAENVATCLTEVTSTSLARLRYYDV